MPAGHLRAVAVDVMFFLLVLPGETFYISFYLIDFRTSTIIQSEIQNNIAAAGAVDRELVFI